MSIAFVLFYWTLPLTTAPAIEFLVCAQFFQDDSDVDAISALVVEDITCLMMWAISRMAPLLWGIVELLERKKRSPA